MALSQAVYEGTAAVEELTAERIECPDEIRKSLEKGRIPLLVDPECRYLKELKPMALVDAILAKRIWGQIKRWQNIPLHWGLDLQWGRCGSGDRDHARTFAWPDHPGGNGYAEYGRSGVMPVTERSGWFMPRRMGRFISSMTSGILWKKENPGV